MKLRELGTGRYLLEGVVSVADAVAIRVEVDALLQREDVDDDTPDVFDLSGVIDGTSVMIALMMVWLREAVRQHRQITFQGVPEPLYELIEFYGLDTVLPMLGRGDAS